MTLAFDPPPVGDSVLAGLDPRWRLAALVIAASAAAVPRTVSAAAAAFAGAMLLAIVARLPTRWVLRRYAALAVFLGPFMVLLPVLQGAEGARLALQVSLKGFAVVTIALVLLATAPLPTTLHAAQRLWVPGIVVQVALHSYRYVFVLTDELGRLRRALRARGFRARPDRRTYRTAGHLVGTLLIRGSERAEGVARAMRCRAFDGRYRSLTEFRTRARDVVFFAAVVCTAIAIVIGDLAILLPSPLVGEG
jgi:cobalt/nickel transport system permease protein